MKTNILINLIFSLTLLFIFSCKNEKQREEGVKVSNSEETVKNPTNVVEIITKSMEFEVQDTIPSGWNTFKYDNRANETHFFRFVKMPKGITSENFKTESDPVFEEGMDLINEGKTAEGFAAFSKLPEWFSRCIPTGGSGLIAPKSKTYTSLFLESGLYSMECYVKMPNGKFHSTMGMVKQIYVDETDSGNVAPKATDTIYIKEDGLHFNTDIRTGKHVFQVNVESQKLHENFASTDVHLVKLEDHADRNALEAWMVWYDPKGFITPVPKGITFLGGFNDAVEGSIGYFYADLKPGNYAFISEVPNAKEKGLFKTFEVID